MLLDLIISAPSMYEEQIKLLTAACKFYRQYLKPELEWFITDDPAQNEKRVENLYDMSKFSSQQENPPVVDGYPAYGTPDICPLFVNTVMSLSRPESIFYPSYKKLFYAVAIYREIYILKIKYYDEADPNFPPEEQELREYDMQPIMYVKGEEYLGTTDFSVESLKAKANEAYHELFDEGGVLDQIEARIAENNILLAN